MIEINRGLYMDEVTGLRLPEFKSVKENVSAAVPALKLEFEAETVNQ